MNWLQRTAGRADPGLNRYSHTLPNFDELFFKVLSRCVWIFSTSQALMNHSSSLTSPQPQAQVTQLRSFYWCVIVSVIRSLSVIS